MQVGDTFTWHRLFTRADVLSFSNITQDFGSLHVTPNRFGQVRVHSLLIASIATKMGGDLNFFSETLNHTFHKAVYTGETITCTIKIIDLQSLTDTFFVKMHLLFTNEAEETVATGEGSGYIPKPIS